MKKYLLILFPFLIIGCNCNKESAVQWPSDLPIYDHIVIVMEENKDYEEVIGKDYAPYINNVLKKEGANFTAAYGEEHFSQGNYYWFFSGDNQNVGFNDQVPGKNNNPAYPFETSNLGYQLIQKGYTFKGYAESLPEIGSTVEKQGAYARKHVPWISFANVPNGKTVDDSCNLRFQDFPADDFSKLPTVSYVIPDLNNDMHNCYAPNCNEGSDQKNMECCIQKGDDWLKDNLDAYYQWAKNNNSLLIIAFDENDDKRGYQGLTNPAVNNAMFESETTFCKSSRMDSEFCEDLENKIVIIFAGAHIKAGDYAEGKGITHVNILRTIEAMYGLPPSGAQQKSAAGYGIADDYIITDVFEKGKQ